MFKNFFEAWHFLYEHPAFSFMGRLDPEDFPKELGEVSGEEFPMMQHFPTLLHIMVVKVDPATESIQDDETLNTATRVWLECGPAIMDEYGRLKHHSHDIELDCGGTTFEEAIIELANLVKKHYGDSKPDLSKWETESEEGAEMIGSSVFPAARWTREQFPKVVDEVISFAIEEKAYDIKDLTAIMIAEDIIGVVDEPHGFPDIALEIIESRLVAAGQ